jgi:hypothetical protein
MSQIRWMVMWWEMELFIQITILLISQRLRCSYMLHTNWHLS